MNYSDKKKTIFLDRDGTINVDSGYVFKEEDFSFLPGAIDGLKEMVHMGYQLILVTNQSGIARGFYSVEDYNCLTNYFTSMLKAEGIQFSGQYFCPHLPTGIVEEFKQDCTCRKPALGNFEKAIVEHHVDLNRAFCIGDKTRDLALCEKYPSVKGILISQEPVDGYTVAADLLEAAQKIKEEEVLS